MCWSAPVSLNTFVISTLALGLAYFNNIVPLRHIPLFMSFFVVQLLEYFLWIDLHTMTYNMYITLAIGIALVLQPLLSILTLDMNTSLFRSLMILYAIYVVLVMVFVGTHPQLFSVAGPNGHFQWSFLNQPHLLVISLYMICLLVPVFYTMPMWINVIIWATLFMSIYYYGVSKEWGTMWCWSANFIALGLLFITLRR